MEKYYLTVNEDTNTLNHIGTIEVTSNLDMKPKLELALESHFDCKVTVPDNLELNRFINGCNDTIEILIDEKSDRIFIEQTWIY